MNDRASSTLRTVIDDVDDGGLTVDMATASSTTAADAASLEVPRLTQLSVIQTVVLSVMFVVALIGNSAALARMYRIRRRRSTINLLLTHLATADLIVTFFCNVTEAVWTSTIQWLAGDATCKIIKFLQVGRHTCLWGFSQLRFRSFGSVNQSVCLFRAFFWKTESFLAVACSRSLLTYAWCNFALVSWNSE